MSFTAKKENIMIDGKEFDICYDNGVVIDFEDEYGYEITRAIGEVVASQGQKLSTNVRLLSVMIREKGSIYGIGAKRMRELTPLVYDEHLIEKMMYVIMANVPKTEEETKKKLEVVKN